MKALAALLLSPIVAFASHSVDIGAFYSVHNERGYAYDLSGISLNYEVGNSKGLKAVGRLNTSNNSDLVYIFSKNELLFYIPYKEINITPFMGVHSLHHQVFKELPMIAILSRIHMPIGLGLNAEFEPWYLECKGAYLHPIAHQLVQDEGESFFGSKFPLEKEFTVEVQAGYKVGSNAVCKILGSWNQRTDLRSYTWTIQPHLTLRF